MIGMFCRAKHRGRAEASGLCADCEALCRYAAARISTCPHGAGKPVCSACGIHCYARGMRDRIRKVMGYAGPRMLLAHPFLALAHLADRISPSASGKGREGNS